MQKPSRPLLIVGLLVLIFVALVALLWQLRAASGASGRVADSAYPQPMAGQPTVEEVGPPPDVVRTEVPGAPPPMKGR